MQLLFLLLKPKPCGTLVAKFAVYKGIISVEWKNPQLVFNDLYYARVMTFEIGRGRGIRREGKIGKERDGLKLTVGRIKWVVYIYSFTLHSTYRVLLEEERD